MLAANNKPTSTVDLKLTGLPVLAAELSTEIGQRCSKRLWL